MNATRKQLLVSGIIQLVIGSFCLIFGIVERMAAESRFGRSYYTITSAPCLAIWMGLWIGITGLLGIFTKVKSSFRPLTGVYLGFSITSVVFAGVMIICYSLSIVIFYAGGYYHYQRSARTDYVMSILILVLSILEFGIGMWASVSCCVALGGSRQQTTQVGQVVYMQTQAGGPPAAYVIVQGPDGTPVAVPAQTSGPMTEQSGIPPHYSPNVAFQQQQQNETKVPLA